MTQRFGIARSLLVAGATVLALAAPVAAQNAPAGQAPAAAPARGGRGGGAPTPACGSAATGIKNVAADSRCFELRTYTVQPESPGNIDVLHARFRQVSARLFLKHGMAIIGFWQPVTKPDTLVYMLAYKDNAARDAQWAAFNADPEWVKARTDMNVRLQVDQVFMNAADYSPLK
jgi:NIPSNAP